jgi:hypothetical protein
MSALPPKADIAERDWDVRYVPHGSSAYRELGRGRGKNITFFGSISSSGNFAKEKGRRVSGGLSKEVEKKPAEYRAPCESSIWRMILSPAVAMTDFVAPVSLDAIETIGRQNDKTGFGAVV